MGCTRGKGATAFVYDVNHILRERCIPLLAMIAMVCRNADEPYLSLLWESLLSESCLPHPLLMDSRHFDHLQVWSYDTR